MILGHGVDIIEISRIQKAVERWGDAFIQHVFTPSEIEYAKKFKCPYPHFAGRFAAKEAIYKALNNPQLSWQDVSVVNDASGKPTCHFYKPFNFQVLLSISHSRDYAIASVIIQK